MDITLDYNIELFPLKADQSFALALASSLARGPPNTNAAGEDEEKDTDAWRPDGKGRRGLEEDYDYVMYGKVRVGIGNEPASPLLFNRGWLILQSRCTDSTKAQPRSCRFSP